MNASLPASGVGGSASECWFAAFAEFEAAVIELQQHNKKIYDPLHAELERISPRPNLHFEIEALSGEVARYNVYPADLHAWDNHWSPVFRRKAAEVREAWLSYCIHRDRLNFDAAGEESDRLCDVQCDLETRLIEMASPNRPALLWKLERLFGPGAFDGEDYSPSWRASLINAVMDDARRLLGPSVAIVPIASVDRLCAA